MNLDVSNPTYFVFKNKIGRIRDIQVHPIDGKIFFLTGDNLWLMENK